MRTSFKVFFILLLLFCFVGLVAQTAGSATVFPWETPLDAFTKALTGKFARVASLLAIVGATLGIAWGGHNMNEILRTFLFIIVIVGILMFANSFLDKIAPSS